ncbi:MAG: energy coupling factor transporter S component ThiW [Aerococcaceae bacterium]|nr:energy coupling factor transporter S component ThiW [Aerococcaceae bacterium]
MRKLVLTAIFMAVGVVLSTFHITIGVAKIFPIQHLLNVLLATLIGVRLNVLAAFGTSVFRNVYGLGTLLAFPGSMVGAFCASWTYRKTRSLPLTALAEVIGTGIFGAILSYPVAHLLLGREVALLTFVVPFTMSSLAGATIAYLLLLMISRHPYFEHIQAKLKEEI